MRLKSGDGLCDALRGTRVINIGDSLTHQLVETWRVCRVPFSPVFLIRGVPRPDGRVYLGADQDAIDAPLRHRRDRYKTQASAPHRVVVAGPRRLRLQKERGGPPVQGDRPGERVRAPVARRPAAAAPRPAQGGARERRARGAAALRRRRALFERGRVPVHRAAAALEPRPLGLPGARPERGQVRRGLPEPDARLRDALLPRPAFPFCRGGRARGADGRAHSTPSPRRSNFSICALSRGRARGADGRAYERVHGRASDPLHAVDASNNCRHKASELSVWRAVFGKGAIEKDKKKREKRKTRHKAERTRMAVVYNCFAHLESIARFPRPVGSCVFVLLVRRARLAWTLQSRETFYCPTRHRRRRSRS